MPQNEPEWKENSLLKLIGFCPNQHWTCALLQSLVLSRAVSVCPLSDHYLRLQNSKIGRGEQYSCFYPTPQKGQRGAVQGRVLLCHLLCVVFLTFPLASTFSLFFFFVSFLLPTQMKNKNKEQIHDKNFEMLLKHIKNKTHGTTTISATMLQCKYITSTLLTVRRRCTDMVDWLV